MPTGVGVLPQRTVAVEFSGRASEYFGIWLPNLVLTIVTLGIYSPWAKVRNTQYIFGHTAIDGASFAYTARPLDILKGRLIAVAALALYIAVSRFAPQFEALLVVALFLVFPWLVVKALRFRFRNTMYRNVRFDFAGKWSDAFIQYALMWLLMIPSLGFAYPYIRWRQTRYVVNNSRFGSTPFVFGASAGNYFVVYAIPLLLVIVTVMMLVVVGFVLAPAITAGATADPEQPPQLPQHLGYLLLSINLVIYAMFLLISAYVTARVRNLIYNNATLGEHRFASSVSVARLLLLWITNILALACTLGLAWPWVRVRMARYYAECTQMLVAGDLNAFVGRNVEESRALGEEMGEVFDLDIGL